MGYGGGCDGGYSGCYGGGCMGGPPMMQVHPHMGGGKGMYMGGGKGMMPAAPMVSHAMPPMQSTKPMKEGDWMCPSCGNHNYASRVECNKCGLIRAGFKKAIGSAASARTT